MITDYFVLSLPSSSEAFSGALQAEPVDYYDTGGGTAGKAPFSAGVQNPLRN